MGHADRCVTGIPQKSSKRWMRMRMSRLLCRSSTRHPSMEHRCRWIPTTLTTGVLASIACLKLECYLSEHPPICTSVSKLLYPHARIFPPLSPPPHPPLSNKFSSCKNPPCHPIELPIPHLPPYRNQRSPSFSVSVRHTNTNTNTKSHTQRTPNPRCRHKTNTAKEFMHRGGWKSLRGQKIFNKYARMRDIRASPFCRDSPRFSLHA